MRVCACVRARVCVGTSRYVYKALCAFQWEPKHVEPIGACVQNVLWEVLFI